MPVMTDKHPASALLEMLPANKHLGITVDKMADGNAEVRLGWKPEIGNHVGSVSAGALFSLADSTSGAAMISALGDAMSNVTPLARGGDINFLKMAKGDIVGRASFSPEEIKTIITEIETDGVSRPIGHVEMIDANEVVVATAEFRWHIKRNS